METKKIKTIDIQTIKWFDKINGNTYFAQRITLNYGLKDEVTIINQFQYGYSSYRSEAFKCLQKNGYMLKCGSLYETEKKYNIITRESERYGLKRELINI